MNWGIKNRWREVEIMYYSWLLLLVMSNSQATQIVTAWTVEVRNSGGPQFPVSAQIPGNRKLARWSRSALNKLRRWIINENRHWFNNELNDGALNVHACASKPDWTFLLVNLSPDWFASKWRNYAFMLWSEFVVRFV